MQEHNNLPELLSSRLSASLRVLGDLKHPLLEAAHQLYLGSEYIRLRFQYFKDLLLQDDCSSPYFKKDYETLIAKLPLDQTQSLLAESLRVFRHTQLMRLMLREIGKLASTEDTLLAWSDCADVLILHAISAIERQLEQLHGKPLDVDGNPVHCEVIAMGKLGGRELNFSSDIDLIFTYSAEGETQGPEKLSNQEFFTKLVRQFIHVLQQVTAQGFVFRVDLRLRPNGDSGPLISSFVAMENYYQEQGRDWERYAMVKARVITRAAEEQPVWFERLITPFVYRRYVDFSVIESLRSMKALIEREVQLNPRLDDIKRGKGGIREIEFILQNIQLIRGGRMPQLQTTSALIALQRLKEDKLLLRADGLKQAYLFLRKLENYLQMLNDQQTHSLPQDEFRQTQLAYLLDFPTWSGLLTKLEQVQRIVSHSFQAILQKVDDYEDEKRVLVNQLTNLWQEHIESSMAVNLLKSLGYKNAERCYQMIADFHRSPRCRRLNQAVRLRLDRFMIILLMELTQVEETDAVLLEILRLLDNIVGRSAYLALLTENSQALKELLYWFSHSPFISSLLVNHPFLLEVFLDDQMEWTVPSRKQLEAALSERLDHSDDLEEQAEMLRQFKLLNWLMIARAELNHKVNAVSVGRFLSDVAELIVKQVVDRACLQLQDRYPEIYEVSKNFAILTYGKAGSREMNYTSDLDLVFLHWVTPEQEPLVIRLTQKILHMLTTRSQSGILYAVDTRLRPSGAAGLLVSRLDAFVEYQKSEAWTWEHQAIIKARVIVGNARIKRILLELKKELFLMKRDQDDLKEQVLAMRNKIGWPDKENPIKYAPGGLLDLEFMAQYWVLASGAGELADYTHTLSLLWQLFVHKVIRSEDYARLARVYRRYHKELHLSLLKTTHAANLKPLQDEILALETAYQLNYWKSA